MTLRELESGELDNMPVVHEPLPLTYFCGQCLQYFDIEDLGQHMNKAGEGSCPRRVVLPPVGKVFMNSPQGEGDPEVPTK